MFCLSRVTLEAGEISLSINGRLHLKQGILAPRAAVNHVRQLCETTTNWTSWMRVPTHAHARTLANSCRSFY